MKRFLVVAAPLFLTFPAVADYAECDQYVDVHDSERADFDSRFRNHDKRVLEPLRRQIAELDNDLGDVADIDNRVQKLEKKNRGYEGDNRGAYRKKAKEAAKVQSNQQLIVEKRRQIADADADGNSKRANKLRDEISKLTKKIGKLQASIAEREVKIAGREKKIAANKAEISGLERQLNRASTATLLKQRRSINERLQQEIETFERAQRVVDVTQAAIDLCEAHEDLRAQFEGRP